MADMTSGKIHSPGEFTEWCTAPYIADDEGGGVAGGPGGSKRQLDRFQFKDVVNDAEIHVNSRKTRGFHR